MNFNFNRNVIMASAVALLAIVVVGGIFAFSWRGHMGFKEGRFGEKGQMGERMGEKEFGEKGNCNQKGGKEMSRQGFGSKGSCSENGENGIDMGKMGKIGSMFGMMNTKASPEMQKLLDELRTARENGDSAKVTALRDQITKQRAADQTAQEKALETALAGGYEQWKAYATKQGAPTELFQKITPQNFQTFVEMQALQQKMKALETKLEGSNQRTTATGSTS